VHGGYDPLDDPLPERWAPGVHQRVPDGRHDFGANTGLGEGDRIALELLEELPLRELELSLSRFVHGHALRPLFRRQLLALVVPRVAGDEATYCLEFLSHLRELNHRFRPCLLLALAILLVRPQPQVVLTEDLEDHIDPAVHGQDAALEFGWAWVMWALADPKIDERQVLMRMLDEEPHLLAERPDLLLLADKGYTSAELDEYLHARGADLFRRD
jgi:hypothetical protein